MDRNKPRKDVKVRVELPPDVHDWLAAAVADRSDRHMTMDRMIIEALRYYMARPENALDAYGYRLCCGLDGTVDPATGAPRYGHRGTCRYSAMRGGPEYQALRQMWEACS